MALIDEILQTATGLAAFGAAFIGYRNAHKITRVRTEIDKVHKAVNSTAQDQNRRVDQLTDALTTSSVDVPTRPQPTEPS